MDTHIDVLKHGLSNLSRFENEVARQLGMLEELKRIENKSLHYERNEIREMILKNLSVKMEQNRLAEQKVKQLNSRIGKIAQLTFL